MEMDAASDFEELTDGLWSLDTDEQLDCIEALARIGSMKAVGALRDASPDAPDVKLALLRALRMIGSNQAWEAFDFRWTIEDDKDVRLLGLTYYDSAGQDRLMAALESAAMDDDPQVRELAVEMLERSFGPNAIRQLRLVALADDDPGVRSAAILALHRSCGPLAAEVLETAAATDEANRVQRLARHLRRTPTILTRSPAVPTSSTAQSARALDHRPIPPRPHQIRFNAPPDWPAPPAGWEPTSGWEPPVEWPAAPSDWNYWIAAD